MRLRLFFAFIAAVATMALDIAIPTGGVVLVAETVQACTPGERQALNTAIDVAGYACIIANADAPDESAIADICKIEQVLGPDIKRIVSDFKSKRAAYAAKLMAERRCTTVTVTTVTVSDAGAK